MILKEDLEETLGLSFREINMLLNEEYINHKNFKEDNKMVVILALIGMSSAIALWLIGHSACIEAERLKIENERLRRMNDGQRAAIDELQSQLWFMEDLRKEGA